MKSIREWMAENGIQSENRNMQDVLGTVRSDRKELGTVGFEGLQDVMDALKLAAQKHPSQAGAMLRRLADLIAGEDEELSKSVKTASQRFIGIEKKIGAAEDRMGGVDDPIAREEP